MAAPAKSEAQKPHMSKSTRKAKSKAQAKVRRENFVDGYGQDDTPKAFGRLMQFKSIGHVRQGLDDGNGRPTKKRKTDDKRTRQLEIPQSVPGERLSDFGARVNQALPIAGLNRKAPKVEGMKERQSKLEKKIQKKQNAWRREEARRLEKEEEARDLAEEKEAEEWAEGDSKATQWKLNGRKRKPVVDDDDPWSALNATRDKPKGLHDVVQAPPQLRKLSKQALKVQNGATVKVANVPQATSGLKNSLRKREMLVEERAGIIESYRKLMEDRRDQAK